MTTDMKKMVGGGKHNISLVDITTTSDIKGGGG